MLDGIKWVNHQNIKQKSTINTLKILLARVHIPFVQTDLLAIGSWGTAFVLGADFHQWKYCTHVICLRKGVFLFGGLSNPCGMAAITQFHRASASESYEQISSVPSLWLLMLLFPVKFWFECQWFGVNLLWQLVFSKWELHQWSVISQNVKWVFSYI